jgi:hypothetical protein
VAELEALVFMLGETLLVVAIVVAMTAVVVVLVLLTSAMLMVTIVAIVAASVQCLTPALVGKTLQFAFVVHVFQQLTPLRQYLPPWD